MTIEKGQEWATRAELGSEAPVVSGDATLAGLFTVRKSGKRLAIDGPKQVGLLGAGPSADATESHDLAKTVSAGASAEEIRSGLRTNVSIDLGIVTLDGWHVVMAASLVIRRPFWAGTVEGAMNASFLGSWNVAPSGHPNDGRFDVIRAELSLGDRLKARSRLPSGSHVPHPGIAIRRLKQHTFEPTPRAIIRIDGLDVGNAEKVDVVVVPDATTIVI